MNPAFRGMLFGILFSLPLWLLLLSLMYWVAR